VSLFPTLIVSFPLPTVMALFPPDVTVSMPLPSLIVLSDPAVTLSLPFPRVITLFAPAVTVSGPLPRRMLQRQLQHAKEQLDLAGQCHGRKAATQLSNRTQGRT
jgi:hypothetical protein